MIPNIKFGVKNQDDIWHQLEQTVKIFCMAQIDEDKGWGGARPGSGRPRTSDVYTVKFSTRISPEQAEFLKDNYKSYVDGIRSLIDVGREVEAIAKQKGLSVSDYLSQLVSQSK